MALRPLSAIAETDSEREESGGATLAVKQEVTGILGSVTARTAPAVPDGRRDHRTSGVRSRAVQCYTRRSRVPQIGGTG